MDYDAVVVGAGPSGLVAARHIAEKGCSVLICEKEGELGQKACAEGIPDFTLKIAGLSPSPSFIANAIDGVHIFPPDENRMRASESFRGFIIDKKLFLYALAQKAVAAGASLMMRCEVKGMKSDGEIQKLAINHKGELQHVEGRVVVGADGAGSVVSKSSGTFEANYSCSSCIQYRMVNCNIPDRNFIRMYLGRDVAPLGYAWIFPKNEYLANVGLGVRNENAEPYLKRFIENHPQIFKKARVVRSEGGLVPTSGQLETIVKGNVVLCGDAAGQVLPACAGGIWTGMSAGKDAGMVVGEALESKDLSLLKNYPKRFGEYWGICIERSLRVLKVIDKFSDDDYNDLTDVINGQDILDLAYGVNHRKVLLKMMRNPKIALKFADKLF
jgi:digeranylgeranylglycerophospholipid reductase